MELLLQNGEGWGNTKKQWTGEDLCSIFNKIAEDTATEHSKDCSSQKAIAFISAQLNLQQPHKIYSEVKTTEGEGHEMSTSKLKSKPTLFWIDVLSFSDL